VIGAWLAIRGVRRTYEHLNRRDLDAFLAAWAPDAVFEFPGEIWASGRFEGAAALRGWFERFLATFPGLHFTIAQVAVARPWTFGAANEVTVEWTIDLENRAGEHNRNRGVTAIVIRGAKVAAARDFLFDTGSPFRRIWGAAPAPEGGEAAVPMPATDRD
jgi:ketosteroid isomerase-like protein